MAKDRSSSLGRSLMVLALALALVTLGQTVSLAQADEAMPGGRWQASGVLAGSPAGSFDGHQISYPGGDEELTIEMVYAPRDPSYASAIGFQLYGPDGDEYQPTWVEDDGLLRLTYAAQEAGSLLIQVYNYSDVTVGYDLSASGVGEPVMAPTAAETPAEAESAAPVSMEPTMGALVGNTGGAYAHHTLSYPGDESEVAITLTHAPVDPSFAGAMGFVVYSPSGEEVAAGASGDVAGELTATLASTEAGEFLIQIYNYTDGALMTYSLTMAN